MIKPNHPEIGRALFVSELRPETVVWLQKQGRDFIATVWVVTINPDWVKFRAGDLGVDLVIQRYGPDHELLRDDSSIPLQAYEYLGEV
jgi:hypothetical protein